MIIPGSIPVTGFIAPTDTLDTYAVTDAIYGIDGLRNVADSSERDDISIERRRAGMVVGTIDDGKYWRLKDQSWTLGDPNDWELFLQIGPSGSVIGNGTKYTIEPTDDITIPAYTQYFIYGDLTINGQLTNMGVVVIADGSLILGSGTFSNLGSVSFVTLNKSYQPTTTITFNVVGATVTANVNTGSLTPSHLSSSGGATSGYVLSSTPTGQFNWIDLSSATGGYLPVSGGTMSGMISGAAIQTIPQATLTDLSLLNTNYIQLSADGSADPIESFGTLPSGTVINVKVREGGPGHNGNGQIVASANIITLDGQDIYTTSLDYFEMISEGAGVWRITSYSKTLVGYIHTDGSEGVVADSINGDWIMGTGDLTVSLSSTTDRVFLSTSNGGTFELSGSSETGTWQGPLNQKVELSPIGSHFGDSSINIVLDVINDVMTLTTAGGGNIELDGANQKMSLNGAGTTIFIQDLPTYADDAAAGVGGLVTAAIYKTATGELRIKV